MIFGTYLDLPISSSDDGGLPSCLLQGEVRLLVALPVARHQQLHDVEVAAFGRVDERAAVGMIRGVDNSSVLNQKSGDVTVAHLASRHQGRRSLGVLAVDVGPEFDQQTDHLFVTSVRATLRPSSWG